MTDTISYEPSAAPAPAQEPHPGSLPRRLIDTLFSPIALFQRFGTRPPWVDVMLVSLVLTVVATLLVPREVAVATMEEALRQQGGTPPPGMDAEQMASMQRTFGLIGTVVVLLFFLFAYAGLMTLIFTVVMGGRATFRQYRSVVAHSFLILTLGQLVYLPIGIQQGVMSPTGLSLGVLAGGMDPESFVYQFLNYQNVFGIWQSVVMGLGAATLNRRIGAGTAVAVMLVVNAAIAAIFAVLT